jgi:hypothetical protein
MREEKRVFIGHFTGVKKSDKVSEPVIVVTDYYDTVRYGILETFCLIVPEDAKIRRIEISGIDEIIKVEYNDEVRYYYHQFGDVYDPAVLRLAENEEIEEAEKILRLREIAEEARDVC